MEPSENQHSLSEYGGMGNITSSVSVMYHKHSCLTCSSLVRD